MKRLVAIPLVVTLASGVAWAYWSASSGPGGNGASAATMVNQGATPTASATGSVVTVSWAASTLANGDPVDGYIVKRYDDATVTLQTILTACTGTVAAVTCAESGVPTGLWVYSVTPVFATSWSGAESLKSSAVTVAASETTPPVNAISVSLLTGNGAKSGNTIFYRGVAAGSFTLTNALSDADSGPASTATAALTGTSTGWTHSPSTVSTPAGGPYVSTEFSWTAGSTSSPTEVVTGRDVADNTAATTLSFVDDSTAAPGTITYAAGYQTGRSVAVTFTTGSDSGSGVATRQLQRASAPLTSGSCGTYSSFANLGPSNPISPYTDTLVTNGVCYKYQYVVTDLVGNQDVATSANVAIVDYVGAVNATAGLLSHWRLGESTTSYDTFTDSTDTALTSHTGQIGATWVHQYGGAATKISSNGRVYRYTLGYSIDYTTATPPSPDYSVEADLRVQSNLTEDMAGVIGRLDTSTNTFYMARWEQANASWNLVKYTDGTVTYLASLTGQTALTSSTTYRIRLSMAGTALTLYVNGVLKVSATDATLTAAGKAGIMDGADLGTAKTSSTGIHFDNFQVTPRAADSNGSNTADYINGPTLGVAGAIPGDSNTATDFDGSNDYVQAVGTTGIPVGTSLRSVEMWFNTGSSSRRVLFSYGQLANTQEFGLWLDNGDSIVAWGSGSDLTFALPSPVDDDKWHHVVETYDGTSITIYIDGFALPPQTATRLTAMDSYGFGIGAVIVPGDANSGGYFNGSIDEVSLYTTVLNQATVSNHYQFADLTGPTGVSVAASGLVGTSSRYSTSTTLSLDLVQGTDSNGVASTGNQLLRATATLTSAGTADGACGSYGSYALVTGGMDPASPKSDTVADQACYRYRYVVFDTFGNPTTFNSADIKVDTTAPAAPSLSFDTFTNTYWSTGSTVFYRSAAATGSIRAVAAGSDTASGIVSGSYGFPTSLGTNWSTSGTTTTRTYSWSGTPAEPGATSVTATNNATRTSPSTPFTFTADDTAPTASTLSYADGISTGTGFSVSFTTGTDGGSGIGTRLLQRASATLTGSTCGTFGAFTTRVTNPASPYVDSVSATTCYMYQYLVSDQVGNAAATATSANVVKVEYNGPTGGSVAATGLVGTGTLYSTSTTLSLDLVQGTDPSGIASTGNQLLRATATLTSAGTADGACGTYGTYALVSGGTDPASPKSDTVTDQACYKYQYVVSDTLGNPTTFNSADIKVDTTAPAAPSMTFDTFTNTYWSGTGSTVFYRSAATSGSFRATAAATDTGSGILSYGFPALGTNWTSTPVSTGINTYSWAVSPAAAGTSSVTATNNATLASGGTSFTLTADNTAPTTGTVTYLNGTTNASVSVDFTNGTDGGSGIGTRLLQRQEAPLTGGITCGSFGGWTTVTNGTNPTSPLVDAVSGSTCYKYQYLVSDNVGNAATAATSASIVKVETTGPTGGSVAATGLVGTGTLYSTSTTLSLTLVKGTDPNGVATTGNQLLRATATLTSSGGTANGACGTYGSYALVSGGTDPASPKSDTVTDQACYKYQYVVSDTIGNPTTFTSGDIKVDTTAPPAGPSMSFDTFTNTYWSGAGSTVFYRSAASSGTFRAVATGSDTASGILSYAYPALGTNWTSSGTLTKTYSWAVSPAAAGTSSVTSTNNANLASGGTSFTLTADNTAPTASTVTYLNGTTNASVSVDFTNGTDGGSGIGTGLLQRQEATLTGGITCGSFAGWTTRATNAPSPYVDAVTNAKCYKYQYLVSDNVGNAATVATSANIVKVETVGPTGGSVAATGLVGTGTLYSTSTTLSLTLVKGTDPNGVATTGNQLLRATATLTTGTCGIYGTYALVSGGTDPASPKTDSVADQACYKYQYVVSDTLGNATTNTTGDIKVDTTAPAAPFLSFNTFTNTYWSPTGSTVFYRSAATSGSFRATAAGVDKSSGIVSYAFPALGTNWTSTPVSLGVNTYSWSVAPAASGTSSVTATNNALLASAGSPFTLTADDTAPSAGTVTYLDGITTAGSLPVSFTAGTDGGSGIGTRLLQRASATLTGTTCGTFGAFATRATNSTSPYVDTVTGGSCYKYQNVVADNVGNAATVATSASIVKVDNIGPTGGSVAASGLVGTGTLYSTSTTLSLNLVQGTDPSGVATTGNQLLRATATLTSGGTSNGSCGTYGAYALVSGGTDPASPKSDTVTDQACYKYQYLVSDTLGNVATNTSLDIKVDTTAPAAGPSLTFDTFTNTYWSTGSTVFYRSAAASGSFRATATGSDTASGILSYAYPALGTNWTSSGTTTKTYSWTVSPAAAGTSSATATNNASLTSAGTPFTLTADDTAPSAGTVTYTGGTTADTLVSVSFAAGTDAGSGVGTRLLQRASAPLTGGTTCGTYTAYSTVTNGTNPTSPFVEEVSGGTCYKYQYVVTDNVGNADTATSTSVVKVTIVSYFDTISDTPGLVNYWRLGETNTTSDTFTGTTGVTLQSRAGEIGATWTKHALSTTDAVITATDRIRKTGTTTLGALYSSSAVPASADYTVSADVYHVSIVTNDAVGVVGRFDPADSTGTYYGAEYDQAAGAWELYSMSAGTKAALGSYSQVLSTNTTYRLDLDMTGSTIRLLVNGVQRVSVTDTTVTAAGSAGVTLGFGAAGTTVTDITGLHLDNFKVAPPLTDSEGTNTGGFLGGPTLAVTGAITGDSNTAAQFDGIDDYVTVLREISDDFSIEFWFKSTQGIGTSSNWYNGAGLVDADVSGTMDDFGVSLRSDGKVVAGTGGGNDDSIVSTSGGYDNGAWHHVVFTRTNSSGALKLYVDGVAAGTTTGQNAVSLTSSANINFGKIQSATNKYFLGSLDEVAVYNAVLSGPMVTTHYNAAQ